MYFFLIIYMYVCKQHCIYKYIYLSIYICIFFLLYIYINIFAFLHVHKFLYILKKIYIYELFYSFFVFSLFCSRMFWREYPRVQGTHDRPPRLVVAPPVPSQNESLKTPMRASGPKWEVTQVLWPLLWPNGGQCHCAHCAHFGVRDFVSRAKHSIKLGSR